MAIEFKNSTFHIASESVSYLIGLEKGKLTHLYWGNAISNYDIPFVSKYHNVIWSNSNDVMNIELPTFGTGDYRSPMLELEFENGARVAELGYKSHSIYKGKPKLKGLPSTYIENNTEAETLEITLFDNLEKIEVILIYTIFETGAISNCAEASLEM